MDITEKDLERLVKRRHPEFERLLPHWTFLAATYEGGRDWFNENIFAYFKEGEGEFEKRVQRAYRFNHTREVVNLVNKYLFKGEIIRDEESATEFIRRFWRKPALDDINIDQFMRRADVLASVYGRIWIATESTMSIENASLADEKATDGRVYAYTIPPTQVLDYGFDDDGTIRWVLVYEKVRDDANPFTSSGDLYDQYRLWTDNEWYVITAKKGNGRGKIKVELEDSGEHGLGRVPVFPLDSMSAWESKYDSPSLINDIAYLDRAVANYLSNLDAIIQDQTFSQLAIPAQGLLPGDERMKSIVEMGTKRVFTYDGEHGGVPFFLSPDHKQAQVILEVVNKIISEIYNSVGVAGERTKQDNAAGIDNSSGVAKAYDFERVNSLLVAKATNLQKAEQQLVELVCLWNGKKPEDLGITNNPLVQYPSSFDVRGMSEEFAIAEKLSLIEAPDSVRREQMRMLIDKVFPRMSEKFKREMERELKKFPPEQPSFGADSSGQADSGDGIESGLLVRHGAKKQAEQ